MLRKAAIPCLMEAGTCTTQKRQDSQGAIKLKSGRVAYVLELPAMDRNYTLRL